MLFVVVEVQKIKRKVSLAEHLHPDYERALQP